MKTKRRMLDSSNRSEMKFKRRAGKAVSLAMAGTLIVCSVPSVNIGASELVNVESVSDLEIIEGKEVLAKLTLANGRTVVVRKDGKYDIDVSELTEDGLRYVTDLSDVEFQSLEPYNDGFRIKNYSLGFEDFVYSFYNGNFERLGATVGNEDFVPPVEDEAPVVQPVIPKQNIVYDLASGEDLVVSGLDFKGNSLFGISFGNYAVVSLDMTVGEGFISVPKDLINLHGVTPGVYPVEFAFDELRVNSEVTFTIIDSSLNGDDEVVPPTEDEEITPPVEDEEVPPTEDDNDNVEEDEEIIFDSANPQPIALSGLVGDSKITKLTINGFDLKLNHPNGQATRNVDLEADVKDGKVILSVEVFQALTKELKNELNVVAVYEDGSTVTKVYNVTVSNQDDKVEDEETPNDKEEDEDKKPTEKPSEDKKPVDDKKPTTQPNGNSSNNQKPSSDKLPNTGAAVASGLTSMFGLLLSSIGAMIFRKRK